MPELHARLLEDVLALGSPYPLVPTGGYAVQATSSSTAPARIWTSPPRTLPPWPTSPTTWSTV
ncbi:hypothetical protein QFZ75_006632 [Streptomyces sp. V3I8]|nr:hypothetical protein [Streptomyces sp. V3I8]